MISRRTGGVATALIMASLLVGVRPAQAQLAQPGIDQTDPKQHSISRWVQNIQNLEVRDALTQITDNWTLVIAGLAGLVLVVLAVSGVFRPSGVGTTPRDVKPFPSFVWLFMGLLILLVGPMAGNALAGLPDAYQRLTGNAIALDSIDREAIQFGGAAVVGSVVGLALVYLMNKSAKDAGLKIGGMDLLIGFGCFLLAIPLIQLATMGGIAGMRQIMGENPPQIAHETLQLIVDNQGHRSIWVIIVAATLCAPIVEELVFRMGLQTALLRLFGNPWPAIVISSGVFAGIHFTVLPDNSWHAMVTLFALGMCLGVAFERTKRLGVPIAMHIAFNVLNVVLAMSSPAGEMPGGSGDSGDTFVTAPNDR